jgi:hypothetical protein
MGTVSVAWGVSWVCHYLWLQRRMLGNHLQQSGGDMLYLMTAALNRYGHAPPECGGSSVGWDLRTFSHRQYTINRSHTYVSVGVLEHVGFGGVAAAG